MSIFVVRAFIRMREAFAANEQIFRSLHNWSAALKRTTRTFNS